MEGVGAAGNMGEAAETTALIKTILMVEMKQPELQTLHVASYAYEQGSQRRNRQNTDWIELA